MTVRRFDARSDQELLAAAGVGDARAWSALLDRYDRLIYSVARRTGLCEHEAEDAYQATCVALLRHGSEVRDASRLAGWIATTTRRAAMAMLRQRPPHSSFSGTDEEIGADEPAIARLLDAAELAAAMERLDPRCRQLLTLLFADPPATYEQAASVLKAPVGSIGAWRSRCLARLHEILVRLRGVPSG